jgi:hypothetical protein
MSHPHIQLIGKEYNTSCILLRKLLDDRHLPYESIFLEFQPHYWDFIKFHRILSIPVLIIGEQWMVGYDETLINAFIDQVYKEQ